MKLKFTKMQGLGNDYIYINCIENSYSNIYSNIPKICDRHFGIGADGVILIEKSQIADFKMRIFNADGSKAEMCGNGIRCVGKYLYDKKITKKSELNIETLCGIKKLKLYIDKNNEVTDVQVDMGEPCLPSLSKSLLKVTEDSNCANTTGIMHYVPTTEIKIDNETITLNCISMGNPHAIAIVENIDQIDIEKYGPIIENDKNFPERTNVEFVEILDENNIKMRVWVRGSKETLACGTGACASLVACNINGYTNRLINVYLLGGVLTIYWNEADNHVYMKGPARTVFEGEIQLQ